MRELTFGFSPCPNDTFAFHLLDACNPPPTDAEQRDRYAGLRLRRILLFHLYDKRATWASGQPIPLVPVAEELGVDSETAWAALQDLSDLAYLKAPLADGGVWTSFITESGYRLCDNREVLFAELCGLPSATFEIGARTVGLVHDAGQKDGRLARMRRRFPGADAVIFGHSHLPLHERDDDGFQIFNPGSPTERRRAPRHSMGIAEADSARDLVLRHVWLD